MSAKKPAKAQEPTPEQLGKMLKNIYESGYLDRTEAYKMTFFKGVLTGLGSVIGATIIVALLLWTLSFFKDVPLLGHVINNIRSSIQTDQK